MLRIFVKDQRRDSSNFKFRRKERLMRSVARISRLVLALAILGAPCATVLFTSADRASARKSSLSPQRPSGSCTRLRPGQQ